LQATAADVSKMCKEAENLKLAGVCVDPTKYKPRSDELKRVLIIYCNLESNNAKLSWRMLENAARVSDAAVDLIY
jgi:deoxyribose-phosphate aldolase